MKNFTVNQMCRMNGMLIGSSSLGNDTAKRRQRDGIERQGHSSVGITKLLFAITLLFTIGVGQMWADNTHVIAVAGENPNNYTVKVESNNGGAGKWMYTFTRAGAITFEGKKLYVGYYNEKYGGVDGLDIHYYSGDTWKSKCSPFASWTTSLNDDQVYNEDNCSWYAKKTVSVGARVYFQPDEDWSQTTNKIWVGHANYQRYYSMSRVTNTQLYYGTIVTNGWTNAMGIGVVGGTSASDGANYFSNASSNSSEYTGLKNWDVNNTAAGNAYLIVSNGDTGETPTMSYHSSHYSASDGLNYTQTIKYAVGVNGGTPAELTSGYVPADIAISSYKFSSGTYNSVSSSSGSVTLSQGGSNYSATVTAARTATTTYTVSNVHEDYSFLGWYSAASGGTLLSSELSYTFYPTSATTAYARFSKENNHTVTISRYCTSTSTEINNTSAKIGEVTYSSIEAPDIHGYTFVNWSLGSGLTKHSSDALTANPIRVITAASGTYTLTANYTEVLTTDWKLIGDNASNSPFGDNYSYASGKAMSKKSGASATDKAYKTLDITKTGTWGFKVATASGNSYTYGWGTGDGDYITFNRSKSGNQQDVYTGSQHELKFNPDGLGEYEFEIDYTAAKCSVKVTFPTVYTVTYGKGTGGNTVSASYSSTSFNSGTKVQSGKTVRFTQTALSGYQFKEWNTNSSGSGTRLSTSTTYDRTVASTNNVYAIYEPQQYTISLNDQNATTAVSPSTVNATYKSLTLSSAITNPEKDGYTFGGWYSAVGGGGYEIINTSGALQASKSGYTDATGWTKTSAAELYAKWTQVLTLDKNGGATDGALTVVYKKTATSSHTAAARSGYTLTGYYNDDDSGNKIINTDGSLVSYSASVSDYISSSGAWIYDGTPELYAHWTPKNYTLTFNGGQGSRPGSVTNIQANVTVTYDDNNFNRSGTPVATVEIPVLTGYTFGGYYTAAEGGGTQVVAANGSWIVPGSGNGNSYLDDSGNWVQANNTTLYAKWTEITHTVTLANGGHGHVEISSATVTSVSGVGIATASGTITAVPDLGYYFTGWTGSDINNGVTIASGSTSTASITIKATADSKTITANFASIWGLYSSINSWGTPVALGNYSTVSTKNYGYIEVDLAANTQYSFKIRNFQTTANYKPTSSNTEITYANKATAQGMNNTASGTPNQTIMTAGAGTYRFTWNMTDHSIVVTYPTSYTVTFGYGTGGSAVTATVEDASAITSGQYAASDKDITFTQTPATGYSFKGWYTTADGNTTVTGMGVDDPVLDDIAANANVYAQYTPKTYTVTLDQQTEATGYGSSGDGSLTATYDAAFPSITLPTAANGYAFMGYYSATGGGGTQFTDASGNLLANIDDYSDASGHWKYDASDLTLYAYYKKAEITGITFTDGAVVAPSTSKTVTATMTHRP